MQFSCKVPKNNTIYLAFSGGIDSIAAALYFKNKKHDVILLHFNHGCEYSDAIEAKSAAIAEELELPFVSGKLDAIRNPTQSLEDFWRRNRYKFLYSKVPYGGYLCTAHHLDDAVETWIFSSMHGEGKVIPATQSIDYLGKMINIYRPFLLTSKNDLEKYASNYKDKVAVDKYNDDLRLMRNYIRHVMMPHVLVVNAGIKKVVKKKYLTNKGNQS